MKAKIRLTGLLLVAVACLFSCDNLAVMDELPEPLPGSGYYDIETIRRANATELEAAARFVEDKRAAGNLFVKDAGDALKTMTVEYTGLEGKSIVTTFSAEENKDGATHALILIADDQDKVHTYYEHIRVTQGSTYSVTVYHEGIQWFTSIIDADTGEVLDFVLDKSMAGWGEKDKDEDDEGNNMSFFECVSMALDACLNDGGCAFMCAVVWKYCLGAIALACYFVTF